MAITMETYRPLFTKLPATRAERWGCISQFIAAWHGALQAGDGYSEDELRASEAELGCRFPSALREWYKLAGKRKTVWSNQDRLNTPDEIAKTQRKDHPWYRRFRESLVFYSENEGCEFWAIRHEDLNLDDPPVFRLEEDPGEVSPAISVFAIQVLLYEVVWS